MNKNVGCVTVLVALAFFVGIWMAVVGLGMWALSQHTTHLPAFIYQLSFREWLWTSLGIMWIAGTGAATGAAASKR